MVRWTEDDLKRHKAAQSPETGRSRDVRYVVGIDPGKTTGVAVWDREAEDFEHVLSTDFWNCVHFVNTLSPGEAEIIIEDPAQIRTIYDRNRVDDWRKQMKIAQNVGGNKREAELLIEGFRNGGYTVIPVKPESSKWDAEYCERVTGWTGPPQNEHVRDAIKLCYQQ